MRTIVQLTLFVLVLLTVSCNKERLEPSYTDKPALPEFHIPGLPTYDAGALAREAAEPIDVLSGRSGTVVELAAGSVDGLAAAIAEAGEGGTVIVKAGDHNESAMVTISQAVTIVGEPGARLISNTRPTTIAGIVEATLNIYNTSGVRVSGLEFIPADGPGGAAIVVENAPYTIIRNNTINDYQFSILIEKSDRCRIFKNTIVGNSGWQTGEVPLVHGIVNINGDHNWIFFNEISNALLGIWACDKSGFSLSNNTYGNLIGQILCNVPAGLYPLPSGTLAGSETPATGWLVQNNNSNNNFQFGYIVIDGANNNFLVGNKGKDNGAYDIELATDSERFGFFTPRSYENWVVAYNDQVVKDCGDDNKVIGGDMVDNEADPCF